MKTYLSIPLSASHATDQESVLHNVAENLRNAGLDVLTPLDIVEDAAVARSIPPILTAILSQCNQVWMADGWQDSPRCRCERAFAQAAGIAILNDGGDLLTQTINAHYRSYGDTEEITYKTTAELYCEVSDIVSCKLTDISEWLQQQQFGTCVIDGTVHWVLYDKRDPSIL